MGPFNRVLLGLKGFTVREEDMDKLSRVACLIALFTGAETVFAEVNSLSLNLEPAPAVEEIIVTARKREENLQDIPLSLKAFDINALKASELGYFDQLMSSTPNVQIDFTNNNGGSSNSASAFIRGVGQSDFLLTTDPGVGVYLDGVYIARSIGAIPDLQDIERIEVLRGPQGTLYGRNTIGGAINLVSRRPGHEPSADLSVRAGNFDRHDVQATFNTPILGDEVLARMSVASLVRGGYADRLVAGDNLGDEDRLVWRGRLLWHPRDALTLDLAMDYSRIREQSTPTTLLWKRDPASFASGALTTVYNTFVAPTNTVPGFGSGVPVDSRFLTHDPYTTNATGPDESALDVWGAALTATYEIGTAKLVSITGFRELDSQFGRDADNTPITLFEVENTIFQQQLSQEFQLSGVAVDGRLDWLAGVYYFEEEGRDNALALIAPDLSPGFEFSNVGVTETDNSSAALFLHSSYRMTEKWRLSAGLRYTYERKRADIQFNLLDSGTPLIGDPDEVKSFEDVSPRLALDYQLTPDVMIYASVAKGFRSGGFTGRYVAPTSALLPYDPEKLVTYEIGAKSQWWGGRLHLNGAVFFSDYENIQVLVLEGVTPLTRNAAEGEISGLEIDLEVEPLPSLRLSAGLGYMNADYTKLEMDVVPGLELGDDFVNTPEWSANLAVDYRMLLESAGSIDWHVNYSFRSDVANDAVNTPELVQDDLGLVNARVAYRTADQRFELAFYGHNLTDERYLVSGIAELVNFGAVLGTYAPPREWGVSFTFHF